MVCTLEKPLYPLPVIIFIIIHYINSNFSYYIENLIYCKKIQEVAHLQFYLQTLFILEGVFFIQQWNFTCLADIKESIWLVTELQRAVFQAEISQPVNAHGEIDAGIARG